jgi:hypothetical protein
MRRSVTLDIVISILGLVYIPFAWSFRVPLLSEELGCSPTLSILLSQKEASTIKNKSNSLYYFDPFKLATDANFPRYREAEYKHGRVAMLAMFEIILVPILKRVSVIQNKWSTTGEVTSTTFLPPDHALGTNSLLLEFSDILPVIITCGILEIFVFVQQDVKDMPGDYGIGYFGLRNKGLHEQQLIMELEHGRLAMIAFVVYMLLDATTSLYQEMSWLDQWLHFLGSISLPQ